MSSNKPNRIDIHSDDNATLTELGTADIEALRADSEPPDTESSANAKKRKARPIVCTDLWEESRLGPSLLYRRLLRTRMVA